MEVGGDGVTGDAIEDVGGGLALGEAEEEAAEADACFLEVAHLVLRLEVAEILLANAALFSDAGDPTAGERSADLAESRASALVRGDVEENFPRVCRRWEGPDFGAGGARLLHAEI